MNWPSASRVAFVVGVLAIATLLWQRAALAGNLPAAVVQVCAIGLMMWARLVFGRRSFHASAEATEGGLVTSGPYRLIRHPIYTSVVLFLAAGVFSHVSVLGVSLLTVLVVAMAVRVVGEERLLVESYPEYAEYSARTKRLIPFVY